MPKFLQRVGFFLFGLFLCSFGTFGQTTVTPATPVANLCVGSSATLVPPIVVSETSAGDFSAVGANLTFVLTAPSNVTFVPSSAGLSYTTNELSNGTITNTTTTVTVTLTNSGTAAIDNFTISNLQVQGASAGAGDVLRLAAGGSFAMIGTAASGAGTSFANITTVAGPVMNAGLDKTVCGGVVSGITLASTPAAASFVINSVNVSGGLSVVTVSPTGPATSTTVSNDEFTNTSGGPLTVVYNVSPVSAAGCTGSALNVTLTVNPSPVVGAVSNVVVCSGGSIGAIGFTADTGVGTTFNWTNDNAGINLAASGSGGIAAFTAATNTTGSPLVGHISVTGTKNTCTGAATTFTITINPEPVVTAVANQAYCPGAPVNIPLTSNVGGSVQTWTNNNAAIGISTSGTGDINYTAPNNTTGVDITGTITVTGTSLGCSSTGANQKTFMITIHPSPVVTAVPNVVVCSGGSIGAIGFTADTGVGTTFNWTNDNAGINLAASGSGGIAAFTAATNTTGSPLVGHISVTGTKNTCTGAATTFTITINPEPVVTAVANQAYCPGAPVNIPLSSNVGGSVITWTNNNAAIGISTSGTGDINYTAPNNTTGVDITGTITVTGTSLGCSSTGANQKTFMITIHPSPVVTAVPNVVVCSGGSIGAIGFTADTGVGTTFNWTNDNAGINLAASGSGGIAAFTAATNTTGSPLVGHISVTGTKNTCTGAATTFTITVNPEPVVTAVANQAYCPGAPVNIPLTSNVGGSVITWTNNNAAIGISTSGTGDINYTAPNNTTGVDITGTITVTGTSLGCSSTGANQKTFMITIHPSPVVTAVPNVVVCSGGSIGAIGFTADTGVGTTFNWTNDNAGINLAASGSGGIAAFTAATNTTGSPLVGHISVTGTKNTCTGAATTFTITINPEPVVTAVANQAYCPGAPVNIPLSSNVAGSVITWTNNNAAIGISTSGTGDINYTAPNNTTGVDITGTITVTGTSLGCSSTGANQKTFMITIHPSPVVTAVPNVVVCSGGSIGAIGFTADTGVGTTFNWTNDNAGINLAASGSGGIAAFTAATNTTGSPLVGHISVTGTKNTCTGAATTFTITINPEPVVTAVANQAYCPGAPVNIPLTSNVGGSVITWTNNNAAIGISTSGTGDINYTAPNNTTGVDITGTITVTGTSLGCSSTGANQKTFMITIHPSPVVTAVPNVVVCSGGSIGAIGFTADTGVGTTFNWTNDNAGINLAASGSGGIAAFTAATNTTGSPLVGHISVTGTKNTCTGAATTFTITINPEPVVTAVANQAYCPGAPVNIPLSSNVAGSVITWTNNNAAIGISTSGTGDINYTAPNNTTGVDITGTITVTGTSLGCSSTGANQKTFMITIHPSPVVTAVPNVVVCSGGSIGAIGFTADTGVGTTFNWTNDNAGINLAASGSGGIAAFTAATNTTGSPLVGHISVTGTKNTCTGAATTFTITINPEPVVTAVANQAYCPGAPVNIPLSSNVAGSVITWTNNNAAIGISTSGTGDINYTAPNNTTGVDIVGTITVTGTSLGCSSTGANQKTFTITIHPSPVVTAVPNVVVCSGGSIGAIGFTADTGVGTTFNWTNDNAGINLAASGSGGIAAFTAATNTTGSPLVGHISVTGTKNTCTGAATTFTITINPEPVVTAVANQAYCPGAPVNIPLSSNVAGSVQTWTNSNAAIGISLSGTGDINYTAPNNTTGVDITGTITVTGTSLGCSSTGANQKTFTITIHPIPILTITNNTGGGTGIICSHVQTDITLISAAPGSVITLQNVVYGPVTGGLYAAGGSFASGGHIVESAGGLVNPTNVPVTITYTFTVATPSCSNPATYQTTVTVNPDPAMTINNTTGTICTGSPVSITLNSPTSGGIITLNSVAYGAVTGTIVAPRTYTPGSVITESLINNTINPVTVTYSFSVAANGCTTAGPFTTTVSVVPVQASNAGPDIDQCTNGTFSMTANVPVVGIGTWTNIGGYAGVTITSPNSPTTTITGLPAGQNVTLRWTLSGGPCAPTTDDVTLLNRALENPANAGPDQAQCNNGTFLLAGSPIVGTGTGTWSITGTGTITSPNLYNTTVTGVLAGTTVTLQWTVTNGSCLSTNDIVLLTNDAPSAPVNAGPDIDQCGSGSFTMAASNPAPGVGTWTNIGGYVGVAITLPNSPTTTITGLPAGNNVTLRWTVVNGSCGTATDDITLFNRLTPAPASAGPNQAQCNNGLFTMAGSDPSPGTGFWTLTAGTATITNPSLSNTTVTGVPVGSIATLTWTVTNGSCGPFVSSPVTLTNDSPPPAASAGLDQDQCGVSTFNLSGSSPSPATGLWTYVSGFAGITIVTPTSPISQVTGLTAGNSVTLRWTVSNGSCPSVSDDVILTNRAAAPPSNAGLTQNQCNNSVFVLAGNNPSPGTGLWSYLGGFAGITITSPTLNTTTVTGLPAGQSVNLQWTISNGSCGSSSSSVLLINYAQPPIANAGPDQNICVTSTPLAANPAGLGTGAWTIISGAGGSFVSASSPTTTFNGTSGVTYTLRWTISNGVCTSSDDAIINMKLVPNVAAGNQTICSAQFTNIAITNPNAVPGTTFAWTVFGVPTNVTGATGGSGSVISQQLTSTDGVNPGSVVYQVTPTSNGCSGTPLNVTVTVNAVPITVAVPLSSSICGGASTSIALSNAPAVTGGVTFNWTSTILSGTVTGSSAGSGTTISQVLTTDNVGGIVRYSIQATATTGGCMGPVVNADVTVKPVPTAAVAAGSTTALCSGSTTAITLQNPNSVSGTTFNWTSSITSGAASGNSSGSGTSILDVLTSVAGGVVQYTITPVSSGCPGLAITWNVTIYSVPTANAGPDIDQCGISTFTLAGNPPGPGSGMWVIQSGPGVVVTPTAYNSSVTGVTVGNNTTVRWTVSNGVCPSVFDDVVLTNRTTTAPVSAGPNQSQCNNSVFTLAGSSPSPGTGLWTYSSGYAGIAITSPTSPTTTVTGLAAGQSVILQWTVSNGSCGTVSSSVTLTNYAQPPIANAGPDQSLCVTSTALAGNPVGVGVGAWTIISGAGGSFVSASSPTTTFNGTSGVTYTLRWTISNGVCTSSDDVIIDMKLVPNVAVAVGSTAAVCSGSSTTITLQNPNAVPGTTFAWTIFGAPTNVSGAAAGSGSVISQLLTSTDGINQGSVVYQITPTSNGCSGAPLNYTVTVNAVPTTVAVPLSSSICGGASTSIALSNAPAVTGGVTFNWTATILSGTVTGSSAGNGTTIGQVLTTNNVGGIVRYSIQATATTGGCIGPVVNADVTVKPVPTAAVAAGSTTSLCSGSTTALTLQNPNSVSGTTFTWTSSVTSGAAGGNSSASGATIADVLTSTVGGVVHYVITPAAGGCPGATVTWDVTVNPVPAYSNLVQAVLCSNTAFSFNPQAQTTNGVTSTFAWTASYETGLTGGAATGTGLVAGTLSNLTGGILNAVYTITPTATLPSPGSCVGSNFMITVPIDPQPVGTALTEPAVCSNVAFTFNPQNQVSNGVASTFNWTAAYGPGLTGGVASGSGAITGTLVNDTGATVNAVYTITPTSSAGTCLGSNFVITVPILTKPKGLTTAAPAICSASAVNYNLQTNVNGVNGVPSNFSWIATPSAFISGLSLTAKSGPIINDVLINVTGSDQVGTYTITATSLNGCVGNNFTITVTVHSQPVGSNSTQTAVCSNTPYSFNPQSNITNGMTSTFTWTAAYPAGLTGGAGNGSGLVAETLTNLTTASLNAVYTITPNSGSCVGSTFTLTVPVSPQPVGVAQNVTRCSSTPVNVTLGTSGTSVAAASYTISVNPNGLTQIGGTPSAGSGKAANELQADVWQNVSGLAVTVVYTVTPVSAAGCSGSPFNVRVAVNPEPVGANQTIARCSNVAVNYDLINNVALLGNNVGSTFSWVAAPNPSVSGESTSPVIGPTITDIIHNTTGSDQTVVYTITPSGVNTCTGGTFVITVTVHAEPVGLTTSAPAICSSGNVNYNLQTNVNGVNGVASSFTWVAATNVNVSGESTSTQTTTLMNDVLINLATTSQMVVYTATPTGTAFGCVGSPFNISIAVSPKAVVSAGPDLSVCNDPATPGEQLQGVITFAPMGVVWTTSGTGSFTNNGTATPTYTYANPGEVGSTITLTITANDPDSGGPCMAVSDQMNLKVNQLPNVVIFNLPSSAAENDPQITLSANQAHGLFTISPGTGLGTTAVGPLNVDNVIFDPSAATLGPNVVTYTYTDPNTCTNAISQNIFINSVTMISFHIDGSNINSSNQMEICANQGPLHITTSHGPTAGQTPYTRLFAVAGYAGQTPLPGMVFTDGTFEADGSAKYFIQTDGLASDLYAIEYDFENSASAKTQLVGFVSVFAAPTAIMNVPNHCISSAINFTDLSTLPSPTLPHAPPAPTIDRWQWNFADGTLPVTTQNDSHTFVNPGVYNVSLTVLTNAPQSCANTTTQSVRVGSLPGVNFKWSSICNNDSTNFNDLTTLVAPSTITNYTWDFGDGHVVSGPSGAAIPLGTDGGFTSGTYKNPNHKYGNVNFNYVPELTIDTNDGCSSSLTQNLFTLPYTPVTVGTTGYFEDFEGGFGGWHTEAIGQPIAQDTISWTWGTPSGPTINTAAGGSSKAWWTGLHTPTVSNNTTYYPFEQTVVDGPCFDLSGIKRPMIAMDIWVDTQKDFDGAVVQYSVNGGNQWVNIGAPNQGVNFYSSDLIISNPGQQAIGSFGWTGQSGRWLNARANLDTIPGTRSQVRIRVAFGSDGSTPPGLSFDGFAFDNVFVGEKQRNVLVEHFTNSLNNASVNADAWLNTLYQNEIALYTVSDFNDIQYHITLPTPDPLSEDNTVDPAARALYYGVSQPPATIMDGLLNSQFTGNYTQITRNSTDRRALKNPPFDLTLTASVGSASNKIDVNLGITCDTATFNQPLIAQVVLVENNVGGFHNIVRQQLFGSAGLTINSSWLNGQVMPNQKTDVTITAPIVTPSQLTLVGYVQNKNTKEIYQSIVIPAPAVQGAVITGLEPPSATSAEDIQMFPNPATSWVNFELPDNLSSSYTWKIIDQRGIEVRTGDFSGAINFEKRVELNGLASAVYIVEISAPHLPVVHRKLVILN